MCATFKDCSNAQYLVCVLPCPLSESQSQVVSVVLQLVLEDLEGLANLCHPVFIHIFKHFKIIHEG